MEYPKADCRNPQMGLDGKICKEPEFWCRRHEVWLSEEDVDKKECRNRLTYDMISTRKCGNLEEKDFNKWLEGLTL